MKEYEKVNTHLCIAASIWGGNACNGIPPGETGRGLCPPGTFDLARNSPGAGPIPIDDDEGVDGTPLNPGTGTDDELGGPPFQLVLLEIGVGGSTGEGSRLDRSIPPIIIPKGVSAPLIGAVLSIDSVGEAVVDSKSPSVVTDIKSDLEP